MTDDLYTALASRANPHPQPEPLPPRPLTTETKTIETVDNDYTGSLLHAISP